MEYLALLDEVTEGVEDELVGGHGHAAAIPGLELLKDGVEGGHHALGVQLHDDQAERVRQRDELRLRDHLHLNTLHITYKQQQSFRLII